MKASSSAIHTPVTEGGSATFSATATGSELSYQWERNGTPIVGAHSASYTLDNAQYTDDGASYRVVVSNDGEGF